VTDLSLPPPSPVGWTTERKFSLATLALGIVLPVMGYVWSTSQAFSRLSVIERENTAQGARIDTLENSRLITGERTARIEQQALDIKEALRRIETKVDKLGDRH
jgi:hypothetical protein